MIFYILCLKLVFYVVQLFFSIRFLTQNSFQRNKIMVKLFVLNLEKYVTLGVILKNFKKYDFLYIGVNHK